MELSPEGEAALTVGLSEALAFAYPKRVEPPTEAEEHKLKVVRRHPFAPPGDLDVQPGPQAVLVVVQAASAVVVAAAAVVAAAVQVYTALSKDNKQK